jgi:hypothetical protein
MMYFDQLVLLVTHLPPPPWPLFPPAKENFLIDDFGTFIVPHSRVLRVGCLDLEFNDKDRLEGSFASLRRTSSRIYRQDS